MSRRRSIRPIPLEVAANVSRVQARIREWSFGLGALGRRVLERSKGRNEMMKSIPVWSTVIGVALAGFLMQDKVSAQNPGDEITFLLPADGTQPDLAADPKDKLIITGGKLTMIDVTGCGVGSKPVQNAVLVDPGSHRSGRLTGLIVTSQADPVHPGTKLTNLSLSSTCTAGGTVYNRYTGTVE
jgi:hypothetical protein